MRSQLGISLIEVLVVLAIIAILTTLAIPVFKQDNKALLTSQLTTDLAMARIEAIRRNTAVTLCPSTDQETCTNTTDWQTGWIMFVDDNNDFLKNPDNGVEPKITTHNTEISPRANAFFKGPTAIQFRSNGRVLSTSSPTVINFFICADNTMNQITSTIIGLPETYYDQANANCSTSPSV